MREKFFRLFSALCAPTANCSRFNFDLATVNGEWLEIWFANSNAHAAKDQNKNKIKKKRRETTLWPVDSRKHLGKHAVKRRRKGRDTENEKKKIYAGHWPQAKNQSSVVQNGLYPFIFYLRLSLSIIWYEYGV